MTATPFDVVLLVAVVLVALAAVLVPRRAATVAAFLVFGIVLAVLWARLEAPDIALAEAALGGGVAGALLVDALGARRPPTAPRTPWWMRIAGILLGAALLGGLAAIVARIPLQASPLAAEVIERIPASGVDHPITAVLLNLRSYDTLLEIAVLAAAALGAASLVERGIPRPSEPSPVLRALAVVLLPVLVLLGGWLLFAGTTRPGGAFQAGALVGAGLVIVHLAGIRVAGRRRVGTALVVLGTVVFILVAAAPLLAGAGWLELDEAWAGTVILALEAVLSISIAAGLAITFLANRADDVVQAREEADREDAIAGERVPAQDGSPGDGPASATAREGDAS